MTKDNKSNITVRDQEKKTSLDTGLLFFHAGRWDEAVALLRPIAGETEDVELHAALAIGLTLQAGPLELGTDIAFSPVLAEAKQELAKTEGCSWPDVDACRAWLSLLEQKENSSIPEELRTLVNFATQSQWFPLRALACRALAFYDRRQEALVLFRADKSEAMGIAVVETEARLEAGILDDTLRRSLSQTLGECLPLTTMLVERWRQLLDVEARLALGEDVRTLVPAVQHVVEEETRHSSTPLTYVQRENARLAARACAVLTRIALTHGQTEQAVSWLAHAATRYLSRWEHLYLSGLVAWQRGDVDEARTLLENSLSANPFQSRVRVELGMLLASREPERAMVYLTTTPDTADAAAGRAMILARAGRIDEARATLAALDQKEVLLPARLVWLAAVRERVSRGWQLRIETAEHLEEWNQALADLQHVHQRFSTDRSLFRAHQMWMRSQYAKQLSASDAKAAHQLSQQVNQELRELAARPLTGDAMFYRSLVAATRLPDRAVKDWQALLRQRQWAERTPTVAGPRLLHIGDGLWKAGQAEDAIRTYRRALELGADGAATRLTLVLVRTQGLPAIREAVDLAPHDPLWPLVAALASLATTPPDITASTKWAAIARERNAPQAYMDFVTALCALLQGDPHARQTLAQLLTQHSLGSLPPVVDACLSLLTDSGPVVSAVRTFLDAFGKQWLDICPVLPNEVLQRAVAEVNENEGAETALAFARRAEQVGTLLPHETNITLLAACATLAGMQGRFDEAEQYLQHAQSLATAQHGEEDDT